MPPKVLIQKGGAKPIGMYSAGVIAPRGSLVIIAGQVGVDAKGQVVGTDAESQTRQAFANMQAVLATAGCTLRDVIRFQTFLTRVEDIEDYVKARGEVLRGAFPDGNFPPNTLLVVSALYRPDLLFEIEAMAVRSRLQAARPKTKAKKSAQSVQRRR